MLCHNQAVSQIGYPAGNNLSAAYKEFIGGSYRTDLRMKESPSPFSLQVDSGKVQGMVFLKKNPVSLEQAPASPNPSKPPAYVHGPKNLQIIGSGTHKITILD